MQMSGKPYPRSESNRRQRQRRPWLRDFRKGVPGFHADLEAAALYNPVPGIRAFPLTGKKQTVILRHQRVERARMRKDLALFLFEAAPCQ